MHLRKLHTSNIGELSEKSWCDYYLLSLKDLSVTRRLRSKWRRCRWSRWCEWRWFFLFFPCHLKISSMMIFEGWRHDNDTRPDAFVIVIKIKTTKSFHDDGASVNAFWVSRYHITLASRRAANCKFFKSRLTKRYIAATKDFATKDYHSLQLVLPSAGSSYDSQTADISVVGLSCPLDLHWPPSASLFCAAIMQIRPEATGKVFYGSLFTRWRRS